MILGILKEPQNENRVAMLPETVESLVKLNVKVIIEKEAGLRAYSSDDDYKSAGAETDSRSNIIKKSDVVVGVHSPDAKELKTFRKDQVLVASLNPFFNKATVDQLVSGNVVSFSMDMIPRTTRAQAMDVLSSQATVTGYKSVLDAANSYSKFLPMFMSAAGTIKPAKILILGAGVAGLQAIATARKLGAVVEVFDVRSAVKEEVMSLGAKFVEVEGAKDDASAGGYAVEQTEDFKKKQEQAIHDHAVKADIVICTAQIPGKKAPLLIHKTTVEAMKKGSIVVDLAASTGGNCELTKNGETIDHKQVKIIGKSDYPSDMPADSSRMYGKNLFNFLKLIIAENGDLNLNFDDDIVKGTCITKDGEIVHERLK